MSSLNHIHLYVRIINNKLDLTFKPLKNVQYNSIILNPSDDCIFMITTKYDIILLKYVFEYFIWYSFILKNVKDNNNIIDFCPDFYGNIINHDYVNFKNHITNCHKDKKTCKNEFCVGNWFNLYQEHLNVCKNKSCIFKCIFKKINELFLIYEYASLLINLKQK